MAAPLMTADQFASVWGAEGGSPTAVAKAIGMSERGVYARRARLEAEGYQLPSAYIAKGEQARRSFAYAPRIEETIRDGCAIVFSDRHVWPGEGVVVAEAALLTLIPQLDPELIVCNGDIFDGARAGRHDPLGWEDKPTSADELSAVQAVLHRIATATKRARLRRTVGNHDRRFDYRLAKAAPDMRGITGMRLSDHLPAWSESWAIHVNTEVAGGHTVIKHMAAGGIHAAYNNAVKAGVSIVTGHTHKLDCRPITDYRGRRWGVQCGMLGQPRTPATEYAEDPPDPGQAGFVVLTWSDGILQPPEMVEMDEAGVAWFRGQPVRLRVRVKAGSSRDA